MFPLRFFISGARPRSREDVPKTASNKSPDDSFREAAMLAACEMLAGSKSSGKFEEEMGHGKLETKGRRVTCGSITGILFNGTFVNRLSGEEGQITFMIDDIHTEKLIKCLSLRMES